jgi:ornithine decarboxylase
LTKNLEKTTSTLQLTFFTLSSKTFQQVNRTTKRFMQTASTILPPILANLDTFTVQHGESVTDHIRNYIEQNGRSEDPFYLVDLEHVVRKYHEWRELMPRVEPHYAVKCNPNPAIMKTLKSLGARFDCASKEEIEAVLALGDVDAEHDIIYANPTKPRSHLQVAKRHGVKMMTFDNSDELHKIKAVYPDAQLVLRIMTDDSKATCRFSAKYGAPFNVCQDLLKLAIELQLNVIGVSFHVGSGQTDPAAFADAVERAHRVFLIAKDLGLHFTLLDLGGGYPGTDPNSEHSRISLQSIAAHVRPKLDELFPATDNVHIIAEPGRYFAHGAYTLVCNVIARRDTSGFHDANTNPEDVVNYIYYINDGVYGSFNCKFFDHYVPKAKVLGRENTAAVFPSTMFGPTCDALDCIYKREMLPILNIGDWIYFNEMGAYTTAAASAFNGFTLTKLVYIRRRSSEMF